MEDGGKVTDVSVTIDGQPFETGMPLRAGQTVVIDYTINRGEDDRHVRLLGTVDDRITDQIRLNSIEDRDSGAKASSFLGVLVAERLNDPSKLSEALSARNYDVHLDVERLNPNWSDIEFPSDHLSVKRLRTIFPEKFDKGSAISDGYSTFFEPSNDEYSAHLQRLNDLISHERTVVDFGFYKALDSVDDFCRKELKEASEALVPLYQEFKLADSPETARLLIQGLEEQGAEQARQINSRSR